ncbi:MAG: hypothetical protein PHQ14_11980, partial [Chromatiales bacterium]|nr:hypothetical protein [Chromatiales bacterium]
MAPETRKGIDGPGRGNGIGDVTAPVRRLLLMFIPFLLTACGDESGIHTVGGYAVDGPLAGAVVEVSGSQGATGADGRFSIDVSTAPPYRLRVSGGTLDGIPYEGVLEAWCETTECHVTPWTTAVVRLMDRYGFNAGDARAALAGMAGVDGDPFMQVLADGESVPVQGFKPNAVRDIPEDSAGLGDWVDGIVRGDSDCQSSDATRTSVAPGCDEPPPENALSPLPLPRYVQVCNNGNLAGEGGCPDSPAPGDAGDQWACTHDRDTGLTWELKVDDPTHLRYM